MASKILLQIFLAVLLLKLCHGNGISGPHQVTTTITSQGTDPVKPTSSSCSAENSFETVSQLLQITIQQTEIKTTEESVTTFKTTELQTSATSMPTELQMSATSMPSENMMNESFYATGFEKWTITKNITSNQTTLSCEENTILYIHQACYCGRCCMGNCGCPEITKNMSKICNLKRSCNMTIYDIFTKLEEYEDCQISVSYTCVEKDSLAGKILNNSDWYQASNKYWYQYDENVKTKFSAANETCILSGGRLASKGIRDNNTKWQLVHKYEWKQKDEPRIRWVGLSHIITQNLWVWNDGKHMTNELWKREEPNGWGRENCGYIDAHWNWMMNDGICSMTGPYVCETPCDMSYKGRCFRIEKSNTKRTFESACSSFGGRWQLATVYNQAQLNHMRDQISSSSTKSISLWLGMTKEVTNMTICLQPETSYNNTNLAVYINSANRCLNVTEKSDTLDGSICEYVDGGG